MTTPSTWRGAVFGLGNLDRGDDAVGPLVARGVGPRCDDRVLSLAGRDPLDLLDDCIGIDLLVVVDAVKTGTTAPGTVSVHRLEDLPAGAAAPGSSHAVPLQQAVRLAEVLHRAPGRVLVVGVEAEQFEIGSALSPAVARALPAAVDTCVALLSGRGVVGHVSG
jgi:hydrogenase maturation protease